LELVQVLELVSYCYYYHYY